MKPRRFASKIAAFFLCLALAVTSATRNWLREMVSPPLATAAPSPTFDRCSQKLAEGNGAASDSRSHALRPTTENDTPGQIAAGLEGRDEIREQFRRLKGRFPQLEERSIVLATESWLKQPRPAPEEGLISFALDAEGIEAVWIDLAELAGTRPEDLERHGILSGEATEFRERVDDLVTYVGDYVDKLRRLFPQIRLSEGNWPTLVSAVTTVLQARGLMLAIQTADFESLIPDIQLDEEMDDEGQVAEAPSWLSGLKIEIQPPETSTFSDRVLTVLADQPLDRTVQTSYDSAANKLRFVLQEPSPAAGLEGVFVGGHLSLSDLPGQIGSLISEKVSSLGAASARIVDESDYEDLLKEAQQRGLVIPLRDGPVFVPSQSLKRSGEVTHVVSGERQDSSRVNNWIHTDELSQKLGFDPQQEFRVSMQGRTLYVAPFLRHSPDSPFAKAGIQITDDLRVVLAAIQMSRVGRVALDRLGSQSGSPVFAIHSSGREGERPFLVHLLEKNMILSRGLEYAGDALSLKKPAFRLANHEAAEENGPTHLEPDRPYQPGAIALVLHMAVVRVWDRVHQREAFVGVIAPSSSGKTVMGMLPSNEQFDIQLVGDDLATLSLDAEGGLRAFNPEDGVFAVLSGSNEQTNPNLMSALQSAGNKALLYGVAVHPDSGKWWIPGMPQPESMEGWLDWNGKPVQDWARAVHPINARAVLPMSAVPNRFTPSDKQGVPLSAILIGPLPASLGPLIFESLDPAQGTAFGFHLNTLAMAEFLPFSEHLFWQRVSTLFKQADPTPIFIGSWKLPGWSTGPQNAFFFNWIMQRLNGKEDIAQQTSVGWIPTQAAFQQAGIQVMQDGWNDFNLSAWRDYTMGWLEDMPEFGFQPTDSLGQPTQQIAKAFQSAGLEGQAEPVTQPLDWETVTVKGYFRWLLKTYAGSAKAEGVQFFALEIAGFKEGVQVLEIPVDKLLSRDQRELGLSRLLRTLRQQEGIESASLAKDRIQPIESRRYSDDRGSWRRIVVWVVPAAGLEAVIDGQIRLLLARVWKAWDPKEPLGQQSATFRAASRNLRRYGFSVFDLERTRTDEAGWWSTNLELRPSRSLKEDRRASKSLERFMEEEPGYVGHLLDNVDEHVEDGRALLWHGPDGQWVVMNRLTGIPDKDKDGKPDLLDAIKNKVSLSPSERTSGEGLAYVVEAAEGGAEIWSDGYRIAIQDGQSSSLIKLTSPAAKVRGTLVYVRFWAAGLEGESEKEEEQHLTGELRQRGSESDLYEDRLARDRKRQPREHVIGSPSRHSGLSIRMERRLGVVSRLITQHPEWGIRDVPHFLQLLGKTWHKQLDRLAQKRFETNVLRLLKRVAPQKSIPRKTVPGGEGTPPAAGLEGVERFASMEAFLAKHGKRLQELDLLDQARVFSRAGQIMTFEEVPMTESAIAYTHSDWVDSVGRQIKSDFILTTFMSPDGRVHPPAAVIRQTGRELPQPNPAVATIELESADLIDQLTPGFVYVVAVNKNLAGQVIGPVIGILTFDEQGKTIHAIFA